LGYITERQRKKKTEETKEENPSRARIASVTRNERKALEFRTIGGDKDAFFPWKWALGKKILADIRMFFLRYN
jgi:hypothetical protein